MVTSITYPYVARESHLGNVFGNHTLRKTKNYTFILKYGWFSSYDVPFSFYNGVGKSLWGTLRGLPRRWTWRKEKDQEGKDFEKPKIGNVKQCLDGNLEETSNKQLRKQDICKEEGQQTLYFSVVCDGGSRGRFPATPATGPRPSSPPYKEWRYGVL